MCILTVASILGSVLQITLLNALLITRLGVQSILSSPLKSTNNVFIQMFIRLFQFNLTWQFIYSRSDLIKKACEF